MIKKAVLFFIAFCPVNFIRIFLYRLLLGYKISFRSKVGMFNYLNLKTCIINGSTIGKFNLIKINELILEEKATIGSYNRIRDMELLKIGKSSTLRNHNAVTGTIKDIMSPYKKFEKLIIGNHSTITSHHVFDSSDTIEIGDRVVVGGNASQFWTHGFSQDRVRLQGPIRIGNDIFIGSHVIITPSLRIADNCIITTGTTISKSINESGVYISNQLIKKSSIYKFRDSEGVVKVNNSQYIRKDV